MGSIILVLILEPNIIFIITENASISSVKNVTPNLMSDKSGFGFAKL
jgi:hypothetical protein